MKKTALVFTISAAISAFGLALASTQAFAVSAYIAKEHSCAELKDFVQSEGVVSVESWSGTNEYYSDPRYCIAPGARAIFSYISSSDTMYCGIGYACMSADCQGDDVR